MPFYAQIEKETGYCNAVVESSATLADTDAIQMLLLDELEAKAGTARSGQRQLHP